MQIKEKYNAIPVTGRGGSKGCETSRLAHFPDNGLTHGREVVSLMRRPSQEDSWYSFLSKRLSLPRGHNAAGRIRSIEKSNDLIGNRTRDLPTCSTVPQPTTL
jgi:hypothetical protein